MLPALPLLSREPVYTAFSQHNNMRRQMINRSSFIRPPTARSRLWLENLPMRVFVNWWEWVWPARRTKQRDFDMNVGRVASRCNAVLLIDFHTACRDFGQQLFPRGAAVTVGAWFSCLRQDQGLLMSRQDWNMYSTRSRQPFKPLPLSIPSSQ